MGTYTDIGMLDGLVKLKYAQYGVKLKYAQYGVRPCVLSAKNPRVEKQHDDDKSIFRLQVVSDIHLEMCLVSDKDKQHQLFSQILTPAAPCLALLGDIGCPLASNDHTRSVYHNFLQYCADRFQHVFLLTGNHEYYVHVHDTPPDTMSKVDEHIAAFCKTRSNLHYLNRRSFTLGAVRVIGATLWSHVPADAVKDLGARINDYKHIYVDRTAAEIKHGPPRSVHDLLSFLPPTIRRFLPEDGNQLHAADLAFVQHELTLATAAGQLAVVLTHHAPLTCGTSDPIYECPDAKVDTLWSNPLLHAFATPLNDLFDHETHPEYKALRLWAFGHTHWCVNTTVKTVALAANQRGYPPDDINPNYYPDFIVKVSQTNGELLRNSTIFANIFVKEVI